jgi:NADPH:quinone reductase-like Zn-dependent oxidoreductase
VLRSSQCFEFEAFFEEDAVQAIRFHEPNGPLTLDEVPQPEPGPGQALIKVAATSFNPVEAAIRAGMMPARLPHIPGIDVAGTVDGRPVMGFLPMSEDGAAAEWAVAPADVLAPAPASIPLADAAAVPAVALTAWQGLVEHAGLRPGQRILVNGAGGGVGGFAVQFAKRLGATVIATASPRSSEAVRAAGADQVVDYTSTDVTTAVEPVDVVFNLVRTDEAAMARLVALVRPGGVLVSTGSPAEEDPDRKVRTVSMYVRSDGAQLAEISRRIDAGEITVDVTGRYPLADLQKVYDLAAAGAIRGKVVVTVP